jgi:hypothetical protein
VGIYYVNIIMYEPSQPSRSPEPPSVAAKTLDQLLQALAKGRKTLTRRSAALDLRAWDSDRTIEALVKALAHDRSAPVRWAAAETLGAFPPQLFRRESKSTVEFSVQALLDALRSSDAQLQGTALRSLGRLGHPAAAASVAAFLLEARGPLREEAAATLMRIDGEPAAAALIAAIHTAPPEVRAAVVRAIPSYVGAFDVLRPEPWSGWFRVQKRSEATVVGQSVQTVIDALGEKPSVEVARSLQAVAVKLQEVRTRGVFVDRDDEDDFDSTSPPRNVQDGPSEQELRALQLFEGMAAAAAQVLPKPTGPEAVSPEKRYADLLLFAESEALAGAQKTPVPPERALAAGCRILLEVSVRVRPEGLSPVPNERKPILDPGAASEVILDVTVDADAHDFAIEEPVDTIFLPPKGDSRKPAYFWVRPLREAPRHAPAELRVRLYYHFNLIEELVLCATVSGTFHPALPDGEVAVWFTQERTLRDYVELECVKPRSMHVDISVAEGTYRFHFVFRGERQQKIEFFAASPLLASDLEDLVLRVRDAWYDIVLGESFASGVGADAAAVTQVLRRLALLGRELRNRLFKHETQGAMARIGKWLARHPLADGAIIQVTAGKGTNGFVFPWSLVFDREIPPQDYARPDPDGFWGLRYSIEQLPTAVLYIDESAKTVGQLHIENMQWNHFRNISLQNTLMERLTEECHGWLSISPVMDAATCYELLGRNSAQILYFYAHGFTRHRENESAAGLNFQLFLNHYEKLPTASPLRALWESVYRDIQDGRAESARSWIELTYGKLYLDELYDRVEELAGSPVVILNMCESAQVTPMLSESFVHFFLSRGARAVLGTECPMTIEFAHPFSDHLLHGVLAGRPLGEALLAARRRMMELGNPLGLAYTLFGLAVARFEPPALDHTEKESPHA